MEGAFLLQVYGLDGKLGSNTGKQTGDISGMSLLQAGPGHQQEQLTPRSLSLWQEAEVNSGPAVCCLTSN